MKYTGIFLAIFWLIIIAYPEFLAYLIWGFFLFLGLNIILFNLKLSSFQKNWNTDDRWEYIKIGKYKIYK